MHCSPTSVGGLQESLLDSWNERFGDVHSNRPVVELQFGQLLARQWLYVTDDATILTCTTTLLLMKIIKAVCDNIDYIILITSS